MAAGFLLFLPHIVDLVFKYATHPQDVTQRKLRPYQLLKDGRLAVQVNEQGKQQFDFAGFWLKVLGPMREPHVVLLLWAITALNAIVVLYAFGKI